MLFVKAILGAYILVAVHMCNEVDRNSHPTLRQICAANSVTMAAKIIVTCMEMFKKTHALNDFGVGGRRERGGGKRRRRRMHVVRLTVREDCRFLHMYL